MKQCKQLLLHLPTTNFKTDTIGKQDSFLRSYFYWIKNTIKLRIKDLPQRPDFALWNKDISMYA